MPVGVGDGIPNYVSKHKYHNRDFKYASMVRTKQTAKKSTSGKAPRISLILRDPVTGTPVSYGAPNLSQAIAESSKSTDELIPPVSLVNKSPVTLVTSQSVNRSLAAEIQVQLQGPRTDGSSIRPCLKALCSLGPSEVISNESNDVSTTLVMNFVFHLALPPQFCHMCTDGGELWRCDLCVRSECKSCIVVPPEYLALVEPKEVKYLCLSCHLMDNAKTQTVIPYMVSMSLESITIH